MKKVLIVQRKLQHYRKLLLEYVSSRGEYEINVVEMGTIRKSAENLETFPSKALKFTVQGKKYSVPYSSELISYVKTNARNYDYVILEGATNTAMNVVLCRWFVRKRIPYIVWDAGRRLNSKMTVVRKLAQYPIRNVWKNAASIIAYSSLAKKYFVEVGIPESRICVCQNTLAVGAFDKEIQKTSEKEIRQIRNAIAPNDEKIVLYVGAVESRKRIIDLVQAIEQIRSIAVALVIVGDGEQMDEIKEYLKKKDIKNVHLLGSIVDGVIPYFLACDVFALPSEGGLALNQAMICSKPVIASSADGTELDLIRHGQNGFLFEECNVKQLAGYIEQALSDEVACRAMGEKSREIIDQCVNERMFYENFSCCLKNSKG